MEQQLEHLGGTACWCNPWIFRLCPECVELEPRPGCWRCGGDGVLRVEPGDPPPYLVMHLEIEVHRCEARLQLGPLVLIEPSCNV